MLCSKHSKVPWILSFWLFKQHFCVFWRCWCHLPREMLRVSVVCAKRNVGTQIWSEKICNIHRENAIDLSFMPIYSYFPFCCSQLFFLYDSLVEPSLKGMTSITSSAVNMCTCAYLLVSYMFPFLNSLYISKKKILIYVPIVLMLQSNLTGLFELPTLTVDESTIYM